MAGAKCVAEFANVHEYFKEIDEVKGLIGSLPDIYNDQVAYETSYEKFTCRSPILKSFVKIVTCVHFSIFQVDDFNL